MATIELPDDFGDASFTDYGSLQKTYENKLSALVGQRIGVYGVPEGKKLQVIVNKELKTIDAPTMICKRMAGNLRLMMQKNPGSRPIIVADVRRDGATVYLQSADNPKPRVKRVQKGGRKKKTETKAETAKA